MAPEFTTKSNHNLNVDFSKEKKRLEKFLQSLDSHRYHRIIGDAVNHPFFLDPEKMYTLRELPEIFPVRAKEKDDN